MRSIAITVLLLSFGIIVPAQQPEFKAGIELVTVPVTVTSRDHNAYIADLTAADFQVSDNGERQVVTTVTRERRPVSICIVVDSSGSMAIGNRRQLAVEAAQRVVSGLQPEDEIAIVFFAEKVEERLPWTRVREIKELNFGGWNPIGRSPLNDGMRLGLDLIEKAGNPRRAILLLTDGFENSSRESTAGIVKTRRQSETTVYGFGVGSAQVSELIADTNRITRVQGGSGKELNRLDARMPGAIDSLRPDGALPEFDYLETLVGDSGGVVRRMLSFPEVAMAVKNLVDELQNEYVIGYSPAKPLDGKYRKLKVEVKRKGTFVRHRGGYLALPSTAQ
jgi:Ca-activated chloride channel family protein